MGLGVTNVTIGSNGTSTTDVYLYKPNGSLLTPLMVGTLGGDMDPPPLPTAGTYTIVVDPRINTGSATLTLSQDLVGAITVDGPSVTTTITRAGQNARYTFNGAVSQRVGLGLTSVTIGSIGSSTTDVSLLRPDGLLLTSLEVGTLGGHMDPPPLPTAGTYTIVVDPRINTGSATLTLSQDLVGTITLDGPSVTTTISRAGQNARFTFDGTAGQQVSLNMTDVTIGPSTCCSTTVSTLDPSGTVLASRQVGTSGGSLNATLASTGTHTIRLDPGINTGNMTLTLTVVSGSLPSPEERPINPGILCTRPGFVILRRSPRIGS